VGWGKLKLIAGVSCFPELEGALLYEASTPTLSEMAGNLLNIF